MKSSMMKLLFVILFLTVSVGIPLLQLFMKKLKSSMENHRAPAPNDDSDEIFWEDEIVDNDEAVYNELREAREEQKAHVAEEFNLGNVDELENLQFEPSAPSVPVTYSPEDECGHEGYTGFLRNNLRSSIVASEILGTPKGLQG